MRGVSKSYGDEVALTPTDIEIAEGEFFCLLGPSGGGKTTVLNLIGGFIAGDTGTIEVRGERVDHVPPHKRCVNTVFQRYALFPHMTIAENVGFGLKMAKVSRRESASRVQEALELVDLGDLGRRFPAEISGGQQQRVAVARALVNRPAVLLLDEPLGALDLKLRRRLQVDLKRIHHEVGSTFVYVTHDQEEAMSMADRIAVLNRGRVEQVGTVDELYGAPRTRFVADFIGDSNFFAVTAVDHASGAAVLADGSRVPLPPSAGACETLMVRPEDIDVAAPGSAAWGLRGRVLDTAFLGTHTRVLVDCAACEAPVQASLYGHQRDGRALADGTEVELSWSAADAVVIRDSPG